MATGGTDDTVTLWDLTDRAQPRTLGQPLQGHSAWVRSVAFAPDGHTLATGADDSTVMLWDLTHPEMTVDSEIIFAVAERSRGRTGQALEQLDGAMATA